MELKRDRFSKINIKKLTIFVIALLMGIVSFGATTVKVEARTLLEPVKGGSVYRQYNANNSDSHRYSYLLRGTTNSGYLPDVMNIQNYKSKGRYHTNKGWNINSPYRNDAPRSEGGLEMSHAVFGSKTYFHEVGGRTYLRISGTAVIPQYFHHTKENQQIAVMTREDGRNDQIKVWKATPINLTSSASYDYGFGEVYGQDNWRAVAKVGGKNYGVHTTNDPYPLVAETVDGVHGLSRYYDYGNINLLDSGYQSGINRNQVSKLAGLGIVGGRLMDTPGVNYVMDYTGFAVDIPVTALVSDPKTKHDYEFKIAKTMTTPNGHDARVYVQSLGMPSTKSSTTKVADAESGVVGDVIFKPVSESEVTYRPHNDSLRNFKQTSNFVTEEYDRSTLGGRPSSGKVGDRSFSASSSQPSMIGIGADLMPKFGSHMWHELNRASANVEHVEMRHHGRGDVWVGWRAPSIDRNRHVYTTAGIAYSEMPTARMSYTPMSKTNFKPVVVRHVTVKDGMPQQPFKTETHIREKDVYGFTFKPLSASELRNYGSNLRYTGNVRFGLDRTKPTVYIPSGGRWYSNEFLYLPENGGSNTLYVDIYYEGNAGTVPDPVEHGELLLRERHRLTGTQSNIGGTSVDHRLGVGDSTSISRIRPYGYVYSGKYGVDEYDSSNRRTSSRVLNGTVHTVTNRREDEDWTQWAMFYYDLRKYNYTVEHRNIETNNKIEDDIEERTPLTLTDSSVTLRPLRGNQLPDGYTYANQYQDENGSRGVGSLYELKYDDERNNVTVVFYYNWNEPEETTKRIQGDTTGAINPVDTYLNAGVVTERDAQGVIVDEDLQATTSAVYDTYEAPIAIVPVQTTLNFYGEGGLLTRTQTSRNTDRRIYNDEFLNSLRVDSRIGSSSDVARGSQTSIYLGTGTSTHTNIAMSTRRIDNMEDLQEEAVGRSGATENNRERDYVGRWLDANSSINTWTPLTTENYTSLQASTRDEDSVNDVVRVEAEIEYEVYNRMRHNYIPRVGSDGLEYYEYRGSDFLRGYYEYDGNTRGRLVDSPRVIDDSTKLDVSDIVTDEYIDAEGFNVGAGQIAPVQFKIASELFDDGGSNIVGYRAETIGTSQAINPIVRETDTDYQVIPTTRDTRLDYYEEFAYVPYHIEDELLTQQAVPVGGRLVYVNPYDYMTFPTVSGNLSVMEQNGILATEIQSNVNNFNSSGVHDSELGFDPTHSGYYMGEVDNFEEFKNSIADVEEVNRNYMQEVLRSEKEHNPELTGNEELETRGYRAYNDNIRGIVSRYSRVGSVESATNFNKRLPVTYIHNVREFMLDDVVAVGKDSGYPIVSNSETINEDYITRYTNDLGVAPSDSDKLITTNKGSIYLLPLERENGHKLSDEYYTRLFVNGIGISQFNLVDDDILTYKDGKYLFGTGDNTIYSGERKEVEVGGEDFNDEEHTINPTATPEERGYINGGRRSNNSELNDAVLDDE